MLKTILSHDFKHTAFNQLWKLFSGPLLLLLVPLYLTPEAQGYWFTFISLAALAVFADMGFSTILLQFSAHEFAYLKFKPNKMLEGEEKNLIRIASLFRFAIKWAALMVLIIFPLVVLIGFFILDGKSESIYWKMPWLMYGLASVLVFLNSVALAFIEGCNNVGDAQKIRLKISIATVLITIFCLFFGLQLYALAVGLLSGGVVGFLLILLNYRCLINQLITYPVDENHFWSSEIMPLIWRYAISWISGYFIFSIFTPLVFHYHGSVEAGRVGLSIALWTAIFSISNIWITMILPKINILVSKKEYNVLNPLFYYHLQLSIGTFLLGCIVVFGIYFLIGDGFEFINRFVNIKSMVLLAISWLAQVVINTLAVYMRAHKVEPLVTISLLNGFYVCLTTWLIMIYFPIEYVFLGFFSSCFWVLPWVFIIFKKSTGMGCK